jgi:hypothetical protein
MSPLEKIYSIILLWKVDKIKSSLPLPKKMVKFIDGKEYFNSMLMICLEECRANITQGLFEKKQSNKEKINFIYKVLFQALY